MSDIEIGLGNPEFDRVNRIIEELKGSDSIEKETFEAIRGLIHHPINVEGMDVDEIDEMGNLLQVLMSELGRHGWEQLAEDLVEKFRESNPDQKWYNIEIKNAGAESIAGAAREQVYTIPKSYEHEPHGVFMDSVINTVLPRLGELDSLQELQQSQVCQVMDEVFVSYGLNIDELLPNQLRELTDVLTRISKELDRLEYDAVNPQIKVNITRMQGAIKDRSSVQ